MSNLPLAKTNNLLKDLNNSNSELVLSDDEGNSLNISNDLNNSNADRLYDSNISNDELVLSHDEGNDLNGTTDPRQWYVVYTKPRSEDLAQEQLEKKDISVFLPRIREVKFRKRGLHECIQPLFPSYIFARFTIPDEYYDVKWARGVKRIVGSGDMPIPLDDSIVIFLQEQANEKGLIQPRPNLKDGDRVRVKQGPLEGLWGVVYGGIDPKGRVKILMDILHSGAKVELPYSYVERYD